MKLHFDNLAFFLFTICVMFLLIVIQNIMEIYYKVEHFSEENRTIYECCSYENVKALSVGNYGGAAGGFMSKLACSGNKKLD